MLVKNPHFSDQFCADIENQAKMNYRYWIRSIKSALPLYYDENEKLAFINSKLDAVRENMKKSEHNRIFSIKNTKKLHLLLKLQFRRHILSYATQVEYSQLMEVGKYELNDKFLLTVYPSRFLAIYPSSYQTDFGTLFNFAFLDDFKPLVKQIARVLLFLKLREMEAAIKNKKIITPENKAGQIKVNQIALIHVYEKNQITRENAADIAAKYGYSSKTSGEGLFQDYTLYVSHANRTGLPDPFSKKKMENKIQLIKSTLQFLTDKGKQQALKDIQTLEKRSNEKDE